MAFPKPCSDFCPHRKEIISFSERDFRAVGVVSSRRPGAKSVSVADFSVRLHPKSKSSLFVCSLAASASCALPSSWLKRARSVVLPFFRGAGKAPSCESFSTDTETGWPCCRWGWYTRRGGCTPDNGSCCVFSCQITPKFLSWC